MDSEEVPHARKKRIVEPEAPSGAPAPKIVATAITRPITRPTNPCITGQRILASRVEWFQSTAALLTCGMSGLALANVHKRNAGCGKKWRVHFPDQQCSQTARIIAAIEKKSNEMNRPIPKCIAEMDVPFEAERRRVFCQIVLNLYKNKD